MEEKSNDNERTLLNIDDYEEEAKLKLSTATYNFYCTGADDQITLAENRQAFRRIQLRPRVLIDVSSNLSMDNKILFPCIIAPTSFHYLANREHGELATVRAAVACSTIMCVSTGASIRMETIANEYRKQIVENYPHSTSELWFQLYVFKDRNYTQKLIERAEKSGYKAVVLTVDTCVIGNRECDIRNKFLLPNGIRTENLIDDGYDSGKDYRKLAFDPSLSWKDIQWIRSLTALPIILKGILHPDDARQAVQYDIQGIIVSNHGGRQLDTSQSSIDALPNIVNAIESSNRQINIYLDSGIRRGTDIIKAIALGAKAVLIGRPILWGLAIDGENGVRNILEILRKEFHLAMMLCGCINLDDIRRKNLLVRYHQSKI